MDPKPPGEPKPNDFSIYELASTPTFERAFRRLDKPVAKRVIQKLSQLAANPRALAEPLRALHANFAGLHKYRVGDYRVLFWIDHSQQLITLYTVKHRSIVYKNL